MQFARIMWIRSQLCLNYALIFRFMCFFARLIELWSNYDRIMLFFSDLCVWLIIWFCIMIELWLNYNLLFWIMFFFWFDWSELWSIEPNGSSLWPMSSKTVWDHCVTPHALLSKDCRTKTAVQQEPLPGSLSWCKTAIDGIKRRPGHK